MTFLSPLWLLALIPWVVVALWLLIGRNPRVAVPFIPLWNDSDAPKRRASRALKRPQAAIVCALLALLLALIAGAKPALVRDQSVTAPIAPKIPENVGIVRVVVRETPRPAVLVRLRNQSELGMGTVTVTSSLAAASPADLVKREVELPKRDGERDYFFDLDRVGDVVSIEIVVDDELKSDNRARLVRGHSPAKLEPRTTVSPELARMIDVFLRNRPASAASSRVAIVDDVARLSQNESGVVVTSGTDRLRAQSPVRVSDHPITAHVRDWNLIASDALVGRPPIGEWTPIVQSDDRVLVAVRDHPARQVWVGFNSDAFARSTDFVIFWTDVFDSLGGSSGSEFRIDPSTLIDVKLAKSLSEPESGRSAASTIDLTRALLITALAFLAVATMLWNGLGSVKPPTITQDRHRSVAAKPLA
ncbi:MAG: hypothetical protein H7Z14_11880 [Anaerolineae bacterium]|nr:hypothetical protein [Phycisphaerae bacterium]